MARIFFALALFALTLLIANLAIGYATGDYGGSAREMVFAKRHLDELQRSSNASADEIDSAREELTAVSKQFQPLKTWTGFHILFGIGAALVTILVNSIAVTYFIGTSRWCKEVVDTYRLDQELADRSTRLKRRTFPWSLLSILLIIGHVALGAASDPSANFSGAEQCLPAHQIMAWIVVFGVGWSLLVQVGNVGANYEIIEEILRQVREIRKQRGLDLKPEVVAE